MKKQLYYTPDLCCEVCYNYSFCYHKKYSTNISLDNLEMCRNHNNITKKNITVQCNENNLLRSAFLLYIVPLLGLILGIAMLHRSLHTNLAEVFGGAAGFLLSSYLIYYHR